MTATRAPSFSSVSRRCRSSKPAIGCPAKPTIISPCSNPARLAGQLEARADLVEDLLEGFGLHELSRRYPKEVSLGEQQRSALARALVLRPKLLIADEPTGHQDAGWGRRIFDVLADAASLGTCCLVATHDRTLSPLMDRVISMADGEVVDPA
mgnify:CR=1 FL=1